jgi:hypothetical protein
VLPDGRAASFALACALRTVTDDVSHGFEARDPTGLAGVLAGLVTVRTVSSDGFRRKTGIDMR